MIKNEVVALIAVQHGQLRDSLQALLMAIPQVRSIIHADDNTALLESAANHQPSLILIDLGGVPVLLKDIKAECPQAYCVVLAEDSGQQQAAIAAGADVALVKGFPATRLFEMLRRRLLDLEHDGGA